MTPPTGPGGSPDAPTHESIEHTAPESAVPSDIDWRRVHRITPLLNAWKVAAAFIAFATWRGAEIVQDNDLPWARTLLIALGVVVVAAVISLIYNYIAWRRLKYGFDGESVFLHQGILFRSQRHVRLDRVQSVDINRPLLARAFGFAALHITSAGSSETRLTLAYLGEGESHRLRNEVLARSAGLDVDADDETPAPAAPEHVLLDLAGARLTRSLVRSLGLILVVIAIVVVITSAIVLREPTLVFSFIVPLVAGGSAAWQRVVSQFGFQVATSADGIRLRHGLLETTARTVPPGRVHAVKISQPLLWRRQGWWRIEVTVAGSAAFGNKVQPLLYPVATPDEAALLLSLILPDLGVDEPRELIQDALTGSGQDSGFITTPRRARFIDPLIWRRNGYRATDTAILLRTGRIWRQVIVVPNARIQSLSLDQGPLEKSLDLVNIAVHAIPGPMTPTLAHLSSRDARSFLHEQSQRARAARVLAGPERWMEQPEQPEQAMEPGPFGPEQGAPGPGASE